MLGCPVERVRNLKIEIDGYYPAQLSKEALKMSVKNVQYGKQG